MIYFVAIMLLPIPLIMIIMGRQWANKPPESINHFYGYRTARSMASPEAWAFAHKNLGRLWFPYGIVLLAATAIVVFLFRNASENAMGIMSIIYTLFQLLVLLIPFFITQKKLKRNFDEEGKGR